MRVLISGQAALAVSVDPPRYLYALDQVAVPAPANGDAWRLFDGCLDVEDREVEPADVGRVVERAWALDRSLRIFLFLIDPQEPEEALPEYADAVESLLAEFDVEEDLVLALAATRFPVMVEVKRVQSAASGQPKVLALFSRVLDLQGHIIKVNEAFDSLSDSYFDSELDRERLVTALKVEGAFAELALALEQSADISFLKLKITNKHLSAREAIAQWTAMLQSGTARRRGRVHTEDEADDLDWAIENDAARQPSFQTYQFVRREQVEIAQLLKLRELGQARARTADLIARQRANSTAEQVAKSLSLLAQVAKLQDVPELQLEWARWATVENAADPKTYGHLADALITLGRIGEAEAALDQVEQVGGRLFAEAARARILRSLGRFAEARDKYVAVALEFNDAPEVEYAWMGAADTLKDMGRVDEAIAEYKDLTQRWPLSEFLWSGYALALLDAGRIDEAIITFGKSSAQRPNKAASNGRAYALRQSGRLAEALAIYDQVIETYPNDPVALCGRGDIFRLKGQHQLALAAYDLAQSRSPYISAPQLGRASTLADIGSMDESQRLYEAVEVRFPNEAAAALELVRLHRRKGELELALSKVDAVIARLPHLVSAKVLRAQILQSKGLFDAALTSLEVITTQHAFSASAVSAKANLLISMGRFEDAGRVLSMARPKTQADWSRFLLRTLILQNQQGVGPATSQLEWAIRQCPFFVQRRAFRDALAALELRRQRWRDARRVVESAPTEVSDVFALHAFAASHRPGQARHILEKIQTNEQSAEVISLAEEIARRTRLIEEPAKHSISWISEAERSLILLDVA